MGWTADQEPEAQRWKAVPPRQFQVPTLSHDPERACAGAGVEPAGGGPAGVGVGLGVLSGLESSPESKLSLPGLTPIMMLSVVTAVDAAAAPLVAAAPQSSVALAAAGTGVLDCAMSSVHEVAAAPPDATAVEAAARDVAVAIEPISMSICMSMSMCIVIESMSSSQVGIEPPETAGGNAVIADGVVAGPMLMIIMLGSCEPVGIAPPLEVAGTSIAICCPVGAAPDAE